jgi:plastocyanin
MKITGSLIICGLAAAFTATALVVDPDPPTPAGATASSASAITISNFAFDVGSVAAGATITVRNLDDTEHTATSAAGGFDSAVIAPGHTATLTAPTRAGVYEFVCNIHPSMRGRLIVTGS